MAQATRNRPRARRSPGSRSTVADLSMFGIDDSVLAVGNLELWPSERQVFVAGQRVGVAPREFDVLLALAACHGHVVAREHLYRNVWGRGTGTA